jgi:adenine-specific DNA-methyltransferase
VALALARARIMGARYPYYVLADEVESVPDVVASKGKDIKYKPLSTNHQSLKQGFIYERVPHITLKSIANNAEIDVIWDKWQEKIAPLLEKMNSEVRSAKEENKNKSNPHSSPLTLHTSPLAEWEVPREYPTDWPESAKKHHADFWQARIARQREIDASIAAKAENEYLYDKPYDDKEKVRVAGPFTVESLLPHRVLGVDENDDLIDGVKDPDSSFGTVRDFTQIILENLKIAGVQQAHKDDKINFTSLTPWPGYYICAEGRFEVTSEEWLVDSGKTNANTKLPATNQQPPSTYEKRAAIFVGPEFGTVSRPDLVAAAREAGDADFDVLITCAFNYDVHSSEFNKLGRIPVLKARMNADLHMADDLKNTGKGNLFVIFGEPDIDILDAKDGQVQVKINGVDVFHPNTGEVRSDGAEGIACWFIDTDYNEGSFFVRHAYFLGANDPYKALKTTLKAEINEEAWATLNSDISRPFGKPKSGRIAVKVINHLGDEVMKVFKV